MDQPKNLFYLIKDGYVGYDLLKSNKYFSPFNQVPIDSSRFSLTWLKTLAVILSQLFWHKVEKDIINTKKNDETLRDYLNVLNNYAFQPTFLKLF